MQLIAHRGFAGRYPENTLFAIERATADADMIALDVRRCGSGDLVVFHDAHVDRLTDATGPVTEFTVEELAALDVLDTGTGIPTLERAAAAIPPEVGINIELKERGLANEGVAAASTVDNEVIVSSFDARALHELDTDDPTVHLASLFELRFREDFSDALALDCEYIHLHWLHGLLTNAVQRAHRADMKVNAWTIDTRSGAWALARAGVDGIIADSPNVL